MNMHKRDIDSTLWNIINKLKVIISDNTGLSKSDINISTNFQQNILSIYNSRVEEEICDKFKILFTEKDINSFITIGDLVIDIYNVEANSNIQKICKDCGCEIDSFYAIINLTQSGTFCDDCGSSRDSAPYCGECGEPCERAWNENRIDIFHLDDDEITKHFLQKGGRSKYESKCCSSQLFVNRNLSKEWN